MSIEPKAKPLVFWSMLKERAIRDLAVGPALVLSGYAGRSGLVLLDLEYMRTDIARNRLVDRFRRDAHSPDDVLIMLDCDHRHPTDILHRLAGRPSEYGVIGALAFRRGPPHDPLFFFRDDHGQLINLRRWERGVFYQVAAVGTGAVAIRCWVFDALEDAGFKPPFFRYEYPDDGTYPSEDLYFCKLCEQAGIGVYCDTSLCTPHLIDGLADEETWGDGPPAQSVEEELP